MNIFNELLKSGQNTMANMISNNIGLNGYNNNNNGYNSAKEEKLRGQLHACTYSDEYLIPITKAKSLSYKNLSNKFSMFTLFLIPIFCPSVIFLTISE
jgi:hypothetical protein